MPNLHNFHIFIVLICFFALLSVRSVRAPIKFSYVPAILADIWHIISLAPSSPEPLIGGAWVYSITFLVLYCKRVYPALSDKMNIWEASIMQNILIAHYHKVSVPAVQYYRPATINFQVTWASCQFIFLIKLKVQTVSRVTWDLHFLELKFKSLCKGKPSKSTNQSMELCQKP